MELLDRYLQAVRKYLPFRRQDDIIAELRANMESQLEDKEAELGRPLTIGEQEDWLRQMGAPIMVAARYQPQQYLIGPTFFPIYWYVMRLAFLWATIIYCIVNVVLIAVNQPSATTVLQAVLRLPGVLITTAAWITVVFAAIEFATTHFPGKIPPIDGISTAWSPSSLPPLEKHPTPGTKPRSYNQAVAEIVFGFLVTGWLLLIPKNPFLILGPGVVILQVAPFQLANVWMTFFWWIVALNLVQLAWRCFNLWRGTWQQSQRVQHIAFKAFGLIPIILLITVRDHIYVVLKNPAVNQVRYGATLDTINRSVFLGMSVICAIASLQLAWDISQLALDAYRKRETAR
jgi:hypothetical protein